MSKNYQFSLKNRKKNKIRLRCNFPAHITELETIFQSDITIDQYSKIDDFIDRYNLVWMKEIWQNASQTQKNKLIKQLSFKIADQNQVIASFKHKKPIKQILVLLDGTVGYKFDFNNKQKLYHHPSRPGQILLEPYHPELQFKQFSLLSTSQSIFLAIPFESSLAQNVLKEKQQKLYQMLRCLQNYNQMSQEAQNIQKLSPYFSEAFYKKGEIIYSKDSKNDFLSYIVSGEIQIQKESKIGKTINIVQMASGRFFYFKKSDQKDESVQIKCKSFYCKIYAIPFQILEQISPPITKLNLLLQAKKSQQLQAKIFKKNQKFLVNPLKLLKKRKKKKNNSKKMSISNEQSWDLIGYMANKMKINTKITQNLRHTRSAHVSKRSFDNISYTNSIQRLIQRTQKQGINEKQNSQSSKPSNIHSLQRRSRSTVLRSKSNFLSSIPRTIQNKVTKQSKISLMKKTKYKLLRYAKGQNLYGVNDYL